jgi:hypothetical protein
MHIADEQQMMSHHFLRRHSNLWENCQSSPLLEGVSEERTSMMDLPWKTLIPAPAVGPIDVINRSIGAQPIDPLKGAGFGERSRAPCRGRKLGTSKSNQQRSVGLYIQHQERQVIGSWCCGPSLYQTCIGLRGQQ